MSVSPDSGLFYTRTRHLLTLGTCLTVESKTNETRFDDQRGLCLDVPTLPKALQSCLSAIFLDVLLSADVKDVLFGYAWGISPQALL